MNWKQDAINQFSQLLDVIEKLRDPQDGCPWDIKQSCHTLRKDLLEETYETVEAIEEKDNDHLKEELGDLYLLVTMMSYINHQDNQFTIRDVLESITEKLIRRHPHVFGDTEVNDSHEVMKQWEEIKEKVEGRPSKDSLMDQVKSYLPPMEKAYDIQKKASKVGFDWPNEEGVWDKVFEEIKEVKEAIIHEDPEELEKEMGDLLFSVINISRFHKISPNLALNRTINKFIQRFRFIEKEMGKRKLTMDTHHFELMDQLWEESKNQ